MPDRVFEDDPTIPGDESLLRRIHPNHVNWDESGDPNISSAAFRDRELSVNLSSVMAEAGREPAEAIRGYAGFGLAAITATHARSLNQSVARDPKPDEPSHGIVYGEKTHAIRRKLRDGAHWIVNPTAHKRFPFL
jgi:hypothetical protein